MEASSKYNRDLTGLDGTKTTVDVYRVLVAFDVTDPELQHAIKKLLCAGLRGKCDETQDIGEAILSLEKFKERKGQEKSKAKNVVPDRLCGICGRESRMGSISFCDSIKECIEKSRWIPK